MDFLRRIYVIMLEGLALCPGVRFRWFLSVLNNCSAQWCNSEVSEAVEVQCLPADIYQLYAECLGMTSSGFFESHTHWWSPKSKKIPRFVTCHSRILSDLDMIFLIPWGNGNDGYPSKAAWQGRNDETILILVRGMSSEFSLYDNCGFLWDLSWCFPLRSRWLLEPQEKWCNYSDETQRSCFGNNTSSHLISNFCWFLGRKLGAETRNFTSLNVVESYGIMRVSLLSLWDAEVNVQYCIILYHNISYRIPCITTKWW